MGSYSRGLLFDNFPDRLSSYSSGALFRGGHLFKDLRYIFYILRSILISS